MRAPDGFKCGAGWTITEATFLRRVRSKTIVGVIASSLRTLQLASHVFFDSFSMYSRKAAPRRTPLLECLQECEKDVAAINLACGEPAELLATYHWCTP